MKIILDLQIKNNHYNRFAKILPKLPYANKNKEGLAKKT
jgi:hypothetical protein